MVVGFRHNTSMHACICLQPTVSSFIVMQARNKWPSGNGERINRKKSEVNHEEAEERKKYRTYEYVHSYGNSKRKR